MLAAGQSTQVAQEYQQDIPPTLPHLRKRGRLAVEVEKRHIGGEIVELKVRHDPRFYPRVVPEALA